MRILALSYEYPPIGGGGSRVVEGLCREFARAGDVVELVTMRFDGLPATERGDGLTIHRMPCVRRSKHHCTAPEVLTYVLSAAPRIRSIAARFRPDVIHAHFIFPDGLLASLASAAVGAPYVITAHGTDVPGYNAYRVRRVHRVLAPLWRRVAAGADAIVCPSDSLCRLVRAAGPGVETRVIPNGFDPDRFRPGAKRQSILVVTRMIERKGVQSVIRAVRDLELDWTLDIVGDGPYLPALRALAEGSRTPIRFHGWMDHDDVRLRELYEDASLFALPSESENFPVCLLEAMAAEAAVITSLGTGCEEVVGDAGWLVGPHDIEEIRRAIVSLTSDRERRETLARRGRERLESRFGWPTVARSYRDLFERSIAAASA